MRKICFIYSSIGGPKSLGSLLSQHIQSDVVYLVYQQMPSDEFVETLISCLEEEVREKITYVKSKTLLESGKVFFLSTQYAYELDGECISSRPSPSLPDEVQEDIGALDNFLFSLSSSDYHIAAIVLSGVFVEQDGLEGMEQIKKSGGKIYAVPEKYAPVFTGIQELQRMNCIDEYMPPRSLLQNVEYRKERPHHRPDRMWLIVDDEKDVRELISDILLEEKIYCDEVGDGLDALRKVQMNHYAAMVLDIKMPELDGIKTLDALRTIDPHIPILIITGYDDSQTREALKSSNVMGLLLKPFTSESLKEFIPMMVRQGKPNESHSP